MIILLISLILILPNINIKLLFAIYAALEYTNEKMRKKIENKDLQGCSNDTNFATTELEISIQRTKPSRMTNKGH